MYPSLNLSNPSKLNAAGERSSIAHKACFLSPSVAKWLATPEVVSGNGDAEAKLNAAAGDDNDLMRQVLDLSQEELEAIIAREMAEQEGK